MGYSKWRRNFVKKYETVGKLKKAIANNKQEDKEAIKKAIDKKGIRTYTWS